MVERKGLIEADRLDANGKWKEAAEIYRSIARESKNPVERGEAFIGHGQMYINMTDYGRAREIFEKEAPEYEHALSGWEREYFKARVLEKMGWVYDYEGDTKNAIRNFSQARNILGEKARIDNRVKKVYETSNHFLGRAYVIEAFWE